MISEDTRKLLEECCSGIKMGVDSIAQVLPSVKDEQMKTVLEKCKEEHQQLGSETHALLNELGEPGKSPNPMAKGMSWLKTGLRLTVDDSDSTVADLMTGGCDMGVRSLYRYLNQYKAADGRAADIAKRLVRLEEGLRDDLREYL